MCTTAHWQHVCMLQPLQECPSPVTNQGTIGACSPCVAACQLQHLCGALMLQPPAAAMPQSRHPSRSYWGLRSLCRSLPAAAHLLHSRCCSHRAAAPCVPVGSCRPYISIIFMLSVRCALRRVSCCLSCRSACTYASRRAPHAPRGVLVVGPIVCVTGEDHPPPLTQAGSELDRPAPHDD